jgi:phenylalanyl-tRNA synthetase beta chain
LATALPEAAITPAQRRARLVRRALAARGFVEAVTYSFMAAGKADLFAAQPSPRLANPISADLDAMRPSILPNLADAAARNAARGFADLSLFEVGPQYADDTALGQALVAAGLRLGRTPRHWSERAREVDTFDAKADALAALAACGAPIDNLQVTADAPAWYHPGRSGALRLGPTVLAWFGELHPRVLRRLDLKGPVAAFEVFVERAPLPRGGGQRPLLKASPFQPVERDFAFLVDASVPAEKLLRAAKGADKALITGATLFDLFAGKGLPDGSKSVAVSITLQAPDRTLTDAEIQATADKIVAAVAKATGASLRS